MSQGGEEYHVDEGSPISLTCVLDSTPSPPQYIFWYHNDRMVNYHVERGVKVTTYSTTAQATESKLTFSNASKRDEGNYTCSPSNSVPATVQLYVTRRSKLVLLFIFIDSYCFFNAKGRVQWTVCPLCKCKHKLYSV